jgi:hypothetical protein
VRRLRLFGWLICLSARHSKKRLWLALISLDPSSFSAEEFLQNTVLAGSWGSGQSNHTHYAKEQLMATQEALRMSPQELHDRLSRGDNIVILDVRTEDAVSVHPHQIPGARLLPLASVVEQSSTLLHQATIVCYCT